jgi:uncharacterized protein (TIGR02594 family)
MPLPTHRTTASVLRIRRTAALGDNIIGRLPYGTPLLRLSGPQGDWLRVQATLRDGTLEGWVNKYHVEAIPGAPPVDEPAWITIARAEMGVQEYPGPEHNPRIIQYLRSTTNPATSDETPWCSGFVNWCMKQAGIVGTNSAAARSWLKWGGRVRPQRSEQSQCGARGLLPRNERHGLPSAGRQPKQQGVCGGVRGAEGVGVSDD